MVPEKAGSMVRQRLESLSQTAWIDKTETRRGGREGGRERERERERDIYRERERNQKKDSQRDRERKILKDRKERHHDG